MSRGYKIFKRGKKYRDNFDGIFRKNKPMTEEQVKLIEAQKKKIEESEEDPQKIHAAMKKAMRDIGEI